jgi:SAM-dependent methyltransferase
MSAQDETNRKTIDPIPDYKNLDISGEALQAANRMEARAREPASEQMFNQLVAPLLSLQVKRVLEFGCGTAALARRIARAIPQADVCATDKSEGMLRVARLLVDSEKLTNIHLAQWDILDEASFPFPDKNFDLIISSVVIPYFDDAQTAVLIQMMSRLLLPGGTLAFVEQDHFSDTLNYPKFDLLRRIFAKDARNLKRSLALGLRPFLREAGLQTLPRRSFLWTDDSYGAYTRDLLERFADSACDKGSITPEEKDEWKKTLIDLAESADFFYGIVYHLIAGKRE